MLRLIKTKRLSSPPTLSSRFTPTIGHCNYCASQTTNVEPGESNSVLPPIIVYRLESVLTSFRIPRLRIDFPHDRLTPYKMGFLWRDFWVSVGSFGKFTDGRFVLGFRAPSFIQGRILTVHN